MKLALQADTGVLSLAPKPFLKVGIEDPDRKKARPLDAVISDGGMAKGKVKIDASFIFPGPVSFWQMNRTGNPYGILEFQ